MAIAFGRSSAFSGTGASPLTASIVINLGETVVVCVTFNPTTCAVTGVTDNAAGGSSTYTKRGEFVQSTSVKHEYWSTSAGGAKAATSVSAAFSGTNSDSGLIAAAYTGVLGIGSYVSGGGATGTHTLPLTTQDTNNWVVAHFAVLDGSTAVTAGTGNLRQTDADISIQQGLVDNTAASASSVTCSLGAPTTTPWAAGALELRSVSGSTKTPRPIRWPTIADRATRGLALVSALSVHSYVGRHELRGATQRTKVALPVLAEARITPPPTRTVLLPHMLKGAPKRKAAPLPEVVSTRTPPPSVRLTLGKHFFPIVATSTRIIVDPTSALVRTPPPKAQSFVARYVARIRTIIDPIVAQVRTPAPVTRSIVARGLIQHPPTGSSGASVSLIEIHPPATRSTIGRSGRLYLASHERWTRPLVASIRIRLPAVDSFISWAKPPVPVVTTPAASRPRPFAALVRTPRPVTETAVGVPLSRLAVFVAAPSRARPMVSSVRTPLPKVSSFEGLQGKWFTASRWTRPILALVRALRPVAESTIGISRRFVSPAAPRPRPRTTLVRITPPKVSTDAGSGIARGAAGLQLAIAVSRGTIQLALDATATDSIASQQNVATVGLAAAQGTTITLAPQQSGTISLTTSE